MNTETKSSNFYILTAQVLNDKNLNHSEKILMAILNGLSDENGKCYCGNEWISEKLGIKERAVQDMLKNLEEMKYIRREIIPCKHNPFKKYRLIYVCSNFKFPLRDAENCASVNAENCAVDTQKTAPIIYKKEIIDKIGKGPPHESPPEGGRTASPPPSKKPPKRKKIKEEFISPEERISVTPSQHEALLKRASGDDDLVSSWYRKLSEWKIGKGRTGGSGDYLSIIKWVIEAVEEKSSQVSSPRASETSGLSEIQQKNFNENSEVVNALKVRYPDQKMTIWYKNHVFKCTDPDFDISMLIEPVEFRRYIEKKAKINLSQEE